MIALIVAGFVTLASPQKADAAFRIGADAIWMPLAFQNIEDDNTELDSDHDLASFGGSAHANLGFDIFSVGLKLNYFNKGVDFDETLDLDGDGDRFEQLDVNLVGRIGIPTTDVALFAEGGLTTSPDFDFAGYNVGGGLEYALFGVPLVDFNLGAMGQYVNVSEVDFSIAGLEKTTSLSEGRFMLYLGVDFSL
jgi:hypothetical protein